jgi:hypothetical protein
MSTKRTGSRIPSAASHRNDNASTFSTNESTTGSRQRQSKRDEVYITMYTRICYNVLLLIHIMNRPLERN